MLKCKKITAFFLACLMLLGIIVPTGEAFAKGANHLSKTRISRIEVKDQNGNTIDLNEEIEEDKDCRLEIDWDASEYGADIKKGDYFNVTLPKDFKASKSNFAVHTLDGVQVAKAQVNNVNSEWGGTLNVVFTSLVEEKTDVKGSIAIEGSLISINNPPEEKESEIKENEASIDKTIEEKESEIKKDETSTEKTMFDQNNENNSTDEKCSNIELSLDIESSNETEYYGPDLVKSAVVIDGKGIIGEAEGLYYDLIFPSEEFPIRNDGNWDPVDVTRWEDPANQGKYIDSSATITDYPLIDRVEKRVEPGKTIYRVYLKAFDSTVTLKIPYTFSFKDNITPIDYKFQPEVKFYDANGCLVREAKDKKYSIKYADFKARKMVNLSTTQKQMNYGGNQDDNNPGYISEDGTKAVAFQFKLEAVNGGYKGAKARALKSYTITDTLPTYTDKDGKERIAEFRPEENPGWVLSADGKTVTYNLTERKRIQVYNEEYLNISSGGDLYEEGVQLKLRFPGAKTNSKHDPEKDRVYYKNSAKIEAIPYNPGENEIYEGSSDIDIQLTSEALDGASVFWKINAYDNGVAHPESTAKTYYDQSGMATAEVNYSVFLQNRLSDPLKNIVIIEDAKNFDPRFYISGVGTPEQTQPLDPSEFEIRAIKSDGTYDVITERLYNYREHPINKMAQEEAKNIRRQILDGTLDRESAPALSPKYERVEVHLKNFELPVGAQIRLNMKMKYKDPFKVKYEPDRALNNTAEVNFKAGEDEYNFKASADKFMTPIEESVRLYKDTDYLKNNTPKVGDKIKFQIRYDFKGLSDQREVSGLTFVDLLPEGITVEEETSNLQFPFGSGREYNPTTEIINNYNNTGRNAFIVKFGNFLAGNHTSVHGKIFSFNFTGTINENIVPEKAITKKLNNDNIVYSFFNDDQSVINPSVGGAKSETVVDDVLDINQNGKANDKILMAKSTVKSTLAQSIRSVKRIRSLEPVEEIGDLVYDRAFGLDTRTRYADKDNGTSGRFEYQLRVNNYIDEPLKKLEIYDIIPGFVDGNTTYYNKLVDEIKIYKADENVTDKFDIYYTTDKNPSKDPLVAVKNQKWNQNPSYYEDVSAIKIISKDGDSVLGNYETLDIRLQMKAPEYPGNNNLNDKVATNSFFVRYAENGNFGKSNSVTNGLIRRKNVSVEKIWEDDNNKDGKRPDKAIVKLLANGADTGKELALTKDNNWKGTFTNLDEYKDEEKIVYTVKEVGEKDNKLTIDDNKYQVTYGGTEEKGLTITNKLEETSSPWTPITPSKEDIKVEKNWQDKDGKTIDAPVDKIEVELYRDGKATGKKLELNKANKWSGEFKDLDVVEKLDSKEAYKYSVKEVGEETGSIKLNGNWYKVNYSGSMKDGLIITNKEEPKTPPTPPTPSEPDTITIKVKKDWALYGNKPVDKIMVELYRDGKATGKLLELNRDNNWSGEFKNLDVKESANSKHDYHYTIKEIGEVGNTIKLDGRWFDVNYLGNKKDGFTIVNKEEKPTEPGKPEEPNTPNKPNDPQEPNKPESPKEPENPNNPGTPVTPKTPKTPLPGKPLPKTGNGLNPSTYAWILLGLGNLSTFAGIQRKKRIKSRRKQND